MLYLRKVAELKVSSRGIPFMQRNHGTGEDLRTGTVGGSKRMRHATALLRLIKEIRQILERGDDADFLSKEDIDDEVGNIYPQKHPRSSLLHKIKTFK